MDQALQRCGEPQDANEVIPQFEAEPASCQDRRGVGRVQQLIVEPLRLLIDPSVVGADELV